LDDVFGSPTTTNKSVKKKFPIFKHFRKYRNTSNILFAPPHIGLTANVGIGTAKAVANREAKLGRLVKEQKISPNQEYG
jgi:hypothetical protein